MRIKKSFFIGFFVVCLGLYAVIAVGIGVVATRDTKVRSDGILVLGAKAYHGKAYNPCLVARVEHAVDLYKKKYAPRILVSGGVDLEDHSNEAETMKKIAVRLGVPAKDILQETAATSTYENFLFSQKIMQSNKIQSIIIVTEAFHIGRAALVAKKLGIPFTISPAITSPCWLPLQYASPYFLKEPFAVLWYKIKNKL